MPLHCSIPLLLVLSIGPRRLVSRVQGFCASYEVFAFFLWHLFASASGSNDNSLLEC